MDDDVIAVLWVLRRYPWQSHKNYDENQPLQQLAISKNIVRHLKTSNENKRLENFWVESAIDWYLLVNYLNCRQRHDLF